MRMALQIALLVSVSGCALARLVSGAEDPDAVEVRKAAMPALHCPLEGITAMAGSKHETYDWTVKGCGREAVCEGEWQKWACVPLPLPFGHKGSRWRRGDEGYGGLARKLEFITGCADAAPNIRVLHSKERGISATFSALACNRDFVCTSEVNDANEVTDTTDCEETADSAERATRKVAIERLGTETNCPPDSVTIDKGAPWTQGTEHRFRLLACGKAYACTTAGGRTDCVLAGELPEARSP